MDEKTVEVGPIPPDQKIALVKQAILDIGEVWSEQTENRVLSALFS